ncbi:MAG: glycosyl transferase group 1 [Nitrospirales bacterium]|nr:MAG: glycosyl transferase group 1 [Nitrospirales bacterium]
MELGGQEFRILHEVRGMVKQGHYVVLAVQPRSQLAMRAKQQGLVVEEVTMSRVRWVWLIVVFLKLIARHHIQVVNTHGSIDSWTAAIAGRISHCRPLIIRTRHKSTMIAKTWRHHVLYQHLPHAVVTTGEAVKDLVMRQTDVPGERVISIPTGVDLEIFRCNLEEHSRKTQSSIAERTVVIGTVTFFRTYKGLSYLLEAFHMVLSQVPDLVLHIVGDGPDYASIVRKRDELGMQDRVVLTGYREDVASQLATMDVFVLPSIEAEGVPQSLTQAMAMGIAAIATDVGSIREVVQHEATGLLVEARNSDALAQAMIRLVTNQQLRDDLGQAARTHIERAYSFTGMLARTESVYREFLEQRALAGINESSR